MAQPPDITDTFVREVDENLRRDRMNELAKKYSGWITAALILFLAANTAYSGFPVLGSILAQDRWLPRQLHTRGDRLAFSNGIVTLALLAVVLIVAFQAEVTRLIQLYIVGVFVSFTLSQLGMVRHWNRLLGTERDSRERGRMIRSRSINMFGMTMTGVVLAIVLVTKFTHGAWLVVLAMPIVYGLMIMIRRHYDTITVQLRPRPGGVVLPSRIHAVVLVSTVNEPALRALAFARATRPSTLTALTVRANAEETDRLEREWNERDIPVDLTVLDSPFRDITRPVLEHVKELRRRHPSDLVSVFIPEYVVSRWWEHLLHNQSALRLKARLLFQPSVMVTSVPWQVSTPHPVAGADAGHRAGVAR